MEAAALVLKRTRNIRFVMAGSGDMLDAMIMMGLQHGGGPGMFCRGAGPYVHLFSRIQGGKGRGDNGGRSLCPQSGLSLIHI